MSKNKVPSAYLDRKGDIVSWCSTLASQCELLWEEYYIGKANTLWS